MATLAAAAASAADDPALSDTEEARPEYFSASAKSELVNGKNEFNFMERLSTRPWEPRATIDPESHAKFSNGVEIKQEHSLGYGDAKFIASPGGRFEHAHLIQIEEMVPMLGVCVINKECPCCPGKLILRSKSSRQPFYGCTSYVKAFRCGTASQSCVFKYYPASIDNLSTSVLENAWKSIVSFPPTYVAGDFRDHVETRLAAYCPVGNLPEFSLDFSVGGTFGTLWDETEPALQSPSLSPSLTVASKTKLYTKLCKDVTKYLVTKSRGMPTNSPLIQKLWRTVAANWDELDRKSRKRKRDAAAAVDGLGDLEPTASLPAGAVEV
jgi:hypothetical protein